MIAIVAIAASSVRAAPPRRSFVRRETWAAVRVRRRGGRLGRCRTASAGRAPSRSRRAGCRRRPRASARAAAACRRCSGTRTAVACGCDGATGSPWPGIVVGSMPFAAIGSVPRIAAPCAPTSSGIDGRMRCRHWQRGRRLRQRLRDRVLRRSICGCMPTAWAASSAAGRRRLRRTAAAATGGAKTAARATSSAGAAACPAASWPRAPSRPDSPAADRRRCAGGASAPAAARSSAGRGPAAGSGAPSRRTSAACRRPSTAPPRRPRRRTVRRPDARGRRRSACSKRNIVLPISISVAVREHERLVLDVAVDERAVARAAIDEHPRPVARAADRSACATPRCR